MIRWFVRRTINITLYGCFGFIHPFFSCLYIFEGSHHDDLDRSHLPKPIGVHNNEDVLSLLLRPVFWRGFDAPNISGYEQRQAQEPHLFMFTKRNAVHDACIRGFPQR